jgi:hypothetical protein
MLSLNLNNEHAYTYLGCQVMKKYIQIYVFTLKLSIPYIFRSIYSIYYTNQMHIISYIRLLNT